MIFQQFSFHLNSSERHVLTLKEEKKWQSQGQNFPQPHTPSCHSEGSFLVPQVFCAFISNRRITNLHKSGTVAPFIFSKRGYHIDLRRTAGELFFQRDSFIARLGQGECSLDRSQHRRLDSALLSSLWFPYIAQGLHGYGG